MSTLSQFSGGGIKGSVQRGTISISNTSVSATQTITAVDPLKTMINYLGNSMNASANSYHAYLTLTNSTTVTAQRTSGNIGVTTIVSYEVIEFY